MIFVRLLLIGFTFALGLADNGENSFSSNPNIPIFYELYNWNRTQEIVMNKNLKNQEKLQKFIEIFSTRIEKPEQEIYSMFNRTIYIKNIADKVLGDENSRKNIFKCFFANIDVTRSVTTPEKLEVAKRCFTDVTEDQEIRICSYLSEYLKWTQDYSRVYNPPSDMFFKYYRQVDILKIIYRDDLKFQEKKVQISELLENDQNMDKDEKLYFNFYYELIKEPMFNALKLNHEAAENWINQTGSSNGS